MQVSSITLTWLQTHSLKFWSGVPLTHLPRMWCLTASICEVLTSTSPSMALRNPCTMILTYAYFTAFYVRVTIDKCYLENVYWVTKFWKYCLIRSFKKQVGHYCVSSIVTDASMWDFKLCVTEYMNTLGM